MKFLHAFGLLALVLGTGAAAGTLDGSVRTTDGKAVAGAMVTVWNESRDRKETVYSDAAGRYSLPTGFAGTLQVRARTPYFRDVVQTVELGAGQQLAVDCPTRSRHRLTPPCCHSRTGKRKRPSFPSAASVISRATR